MKLCTQARNMCAIANLWCLPLRCVPYYRRPQQGRRLQVAAPTVPAEQSGRNGPAHGGHGLWLSANHDQCSTSCTAVHTILQ